MVEQNSVPVSAEARGLRKRWKTMAAARFQRLVEAFHSKPVGPLGWC
jgi:hypothetical protein